MPSAISGTSSSNSRLMRPGWVRRHHDLGALGGAAHLDDVGLQPGVRLGALVGHLLGLGQQGLDLAEVEQRVAAVALLDDAGDDVALAVGVLLELALALGLADALVHHLAERLGGDAAEVARGVVARVDPVAVLVDVVGDDLDVHRVGVDLDLGLVGRVGPALVGRDQGVGQHLQQRLDRDALLGGEEPDGLCHVDVAHAPAAFRCVLVLGAPLPGLGAASQTNTVRARSMSPYARRRSPRRRPSRRGW